MTPFESKIYVTRPSSKPRTFGTPKAFLKKLSVSHNKGNGSLFLSAKDLWLASSSPLTPQTSAPNNLKRSYLSLKPQFSAVQPGVSSLG